MPAEPTRHSVGVGVGVGAGGLRRELGPVSWMVLEEMLLCSTGSPGDYVACVSVRKVAGSLGLAKDTVARAIRRLRDVGLVAVVQRRTSAGAFAAATYRITVPDCIFVGPGPGPCPAPAPSSTSSSTSCSTSSPATAQLSIPQAPQQRGRVARRGHVQLTLAAWD